MWHPFFQKSLPEQLKDFKIHEEAGSRKFFHDYSIKEWNFHNYYRLTHNNLNKPKKFALIKANYNNDIDWISKKRNIPSEVVDHAKLLLEETSCRQLYSVSTQNVFIG
ncbi:uncharacterized protein B0P05DRAFT_4857 [Gilbertella persicaria]|uniref:uncharacterized protein n=1 Tax=Gilbertella persicaria TaxID=101096 RepID=UPI00221FBF39|nr:uncharacterized protein B0P05DRAFT_4857 [Gilbertella persicaria]KAI8098267.1 hypothetical protein B0P05DRAFT_4857 [Gilbertella persicaria]